MQTPATNDYGGMIISMNEIIQANIYNENDNDACKLTVGY